MRQGRQAPEMSSDREELERRLEQCRRLAAAALDHLTKERLEKLIKDIEGELADNGEPNRST
jgi:hypothetical protein